ncbi:DUF2892 domain-containing protein [Pseudoduganella sp. LjRoot289]|uniref:YgaP-like transmembrane domain n=1 Tax=Pseudoduganella sp. LjRoot289 TaxID=3342314 RepID=UPI003ED070B6
MFYVKNVTSGERVLRVAAGLLAAAIAWLGVGGMAGALLAASAGGIAATGLFGFCPMCAMFGRRLDKVKKNGTL